MFFTELLKKFLQEKEEEGQKQEYPARNQERNEDPGKYYTDKLRLWVQAYAPAKGCLVEFKNAMFMGLYHAELKKTCQLFMPKELQYESMQDQGNTGLSAGQHENNQHRPQGSFP